MKPCSTFSFSYFKKRSIITARLKDVFHNLHDKLNTAHCEPEDFLALLTWLETFYSEDQAHTIKEQTRNAVRFYTPTEQAKMPAEVRHYLT